MEETHQRLARCSLQSGSRALGGSGRAEGEGLRPRRSSQGRPPRGAASEGMLDTGLSTHHFRSSGRLATRG